MALVNLKTNLKSIKFGVPPATDKKNGGNSNQPFIKKIIPGDSTFIVPSNEDFLLRGGLNTPLDAAEDVARLSKFMFTSVNGPLFIAKQNVLSQISVRTQSSGKGPNEGVYNPAGTIAQAGVGFSGTHLDKQGIDPTGLFGQGPNKYEDNIIEIIGGDNSEGSFGNTNRLIQLTQTKIKGLSPIEVGTDPSRKKNSISPNPDQILQYRGGPNSAVGFGQTTIPIATNNQGAPLRTGLNNENLSNLKFSTEGFDAFKNGSYITLDSFERKEVNISDFREEIYDISKKKTSFVTGIAPNYTEPNLTYEGPDSSRVNIQSPGQKGNIISYSQGKILNDNTVSVVDKINFLPIYKSKKVRSASEPGINDLVKFRIATLIRGSSKKIYTHFRAFINEFNDSYSSNWEAIKYMGRGEDFYKYQGFGRKIALSYTVAAQSRPELMAQYKKLNFIASTLAPDYGKNGYMGGTLTELTLGAWCYELPGFISSFTLSVPQESPWEIAIDSTVSGGRGSGDEKVKELPHICNVSMEFTPIHKFRPARQKITFEGEEVSTYGDEKYIALKAGGSDGYKPITLKQAETNS